MYGCVGGYIGDVVGFVMGVFYWKSVFVYLVDGVVGLYDVIFEIVVFGCLEF